MGPIITKGSARLGTDTPRGDGGRGDAAPEGTGGPFRVRVRRAHACWAGSRARVRTRRRPRGSSLHQTHPLSVGYGQQKEDALGAPNPPRGGRPCDKAPAAGIWCLRLRSTESTHQHPCVPAQTLGVLLQEKDAQAEDGKGGDTPADSTAAGSAQSDDVQARDNNDPVAATSLATMINAPASLADPPGPSTEALQERPHSKKRACLSGSRSNKRACLSCRHLKKMCDGNYPCSSCVARGRQCVYHSQLYCASGFLPTGQGLTGPSTVSHHYKAFASEGPPAGESLRSLYQMEALARWQAVWATFPLCPTMPHFIQPGPKAEDGVESKSGEGSYVVFRSERKDGQRPTKKFRNSISEACMTCRKSKVKCDEQKPCTRCIKADRASTCFPWRQWQSMDPQSNTSLAVAVRSTERGSGSPQQDSDSSTPAALSNGVVHGAGSWASFHDALFVSPVAPASVTEGGIMLSSAPRQTSYGPSFGVKASRLPLSLVPQATSPAVEVRAGIKRGREEERNSSGPDYGHWANVLVHDAEKKGEGAMVFSESETKPGEEMDWNLYRDSMPFGPCNDDVLDELII